MAKGPRDGSQILIFSTSLISSAATMRSVPVDVVADLAPVAGIAENPLVFAVAAGLNYASGMNDGTLIALLGIDKWRMKKPVKHGDTIFVRTTVMSKRETSQADRGVVTFQRAFVNQHGENVQEMEVTIMYRRRPGK